MNNLFHNMINQGNTAIFIDDIIVATETEEGYNEIVEKMLKKQLEENNLFIKPEKCRWKVKEVEFLGVVIELKEVEIQREKVEGVLS